MLGSPDEQAHPIVNAHGCTLDVRGCVRRYSLPLPVIPESALHGVEFPALAKVGFSSLLAAPALTSGRALTIFGDPNKHRLC